MEKNQQDKRVSENMASTCIYILRLSEERFSLLEGGIDEGGKFAEPVSEFSFSRSLPLICIVIDHKDNITHIGKARRGVRAGTGLRRLNVTDIIVLKKATKYTKIEDEIPKKFRRWVSPRFKFGGLVPPGSLSPLIDAVIKLAPETGPLIEQYGTKRREIIGRIPQKIKQSLAEQKEALATALSLANINRLELQEWNPATPKPESFLEGLPSVRGQEDSIVVSDLMKIPNFNLKNIPQAGAAVFEGEEERLTVILANKLPLEKQLGTDLIYYNETYQSFVMVQYKIMEKQDNGDFIFRFPNEQLSKEISRMESVMEEIKKTSSNNLRNGYRFNENPFFLKFCPRITFNPDNSGLSAGMYIHLDYWKLLELDKSISGPRGGKFLSYNNVGRYIDNTSFAYLITKAWVGTNPNQSSFLSGLIREIIETGRTVMLAVKVEKEKMKSADDKDLVGNFL